MAAIVGAARRISGRTEVRLTGGRSECVRKGLIGAAAMAGKTSWQTDAALMSRVGAGDRQACRTLIETHLDSMYGLAQRMLRDAGEAEDVVQEAFFRLWRQGERWRAEAQISTWLYRVVYNQCIDRLRRSKRMVDDEKIFETLQSDAPNPLELREQMQTRDAVNDAIANLPDRQRAAITLVYHQELSNKQAAQAMEISVDALESLLARGRRALKNQLSPRREEIMGG